VAAFGAVANGGTLMRPRLVRATFDAQGREIRQVEPLAVRQVISPTTARVLTQMLTQVVDGGTGRRAAIPGFAVAGKTGTAQKPDPVTKRYARTAGVLSFVGFAPADEPRFAMLVMLDEPKTERWGSEAAAPIFASVGAEILRYLAVPPRDTPPVQIVTNPGDPVPALPVRLVSTGSELGDEGPQRMPDLRGQPLRQALAMLAPLGVRVEIQGSGVVVQQTPVAGAALQSGKPARLVLAPPSQTARPSATRGAAR
jgi:cell division protein FtsI (penicillin-binding protein 3)